MVRDYIEAKKSIPLTGSPSEFSDGFPEVLVMHTKLFRMGGSGSGQIGMKGVIAGQVIEKDYCRRRNRIHRGQLIQSKEVMHRFAVPFFGGALFEHFAVIAASCIPAARDQRRLAHRRVARKRSKAIMGLVLVKSGPTRARSNESQKNQGRLSTSKMSDTESFKIRDLH